MHIQQLEIDNFKSFSGKTVIPFRCGFTTVSGPNGSGKSNIVDSILFCLGLSTSRTMRAEKITDLINNSSRRREASVTITFNRGDAELPDALLQESFSEDEATQQQALALLETLRSGPLLTITRRIKATGATPSSSYYLNSRPSTLGEIHELLAKFNVSPGCYNVMMQGDVAHIVNMSAGERRKILDELAGVAEFDRKIEQAQKEIASASENLDKNQVLLSELERGLEELEQQRTQALRYQQLQSEAKQLEALLQVAVVRDLQRTLAELHTAKQAAHQQEQEAKQAVATAAKTLVQLRLAIEKQREAVKQEGHERHSQLNLRKQELTLTLQRREESQQQYTKKIADLETAKQSAVQDMAVYETEATTHEANLATVAQQETELHDLLATLKQEKDTLEQQQDALLGDATGVQQQRQQVRQQLEAVDDQLATLKRGLHDYEAELERLELAQRQRLQTVASNATKLQQLEERYQKLHQSTQALEERQQTVQQQVRQKQAERNTLHAHTLRLKEQAQQKQERLFKLETFQQAQKATSNVYSVQTILNAKLPGVHGTLAQLLQVPTDYHLALEQALGGRVHYIVVDNEQVAQQGIQLLKSQNAGRATFLPLTKLRAFSNSLPPLPNSAGVIDYALELVSFDALHRIVYQQALGDTLIVEDARQVGSLINRYRMVALDGTVMEKSGSMAGGAAPKSKGGSVFGQPLSNQQDAELGQVKQQLESLHTELAKCEKLLAKLDAELQHLLQQELQPLTTQVLQYQAQSNALEQQLAEERHALEAQQQQATQGDDTTAHARMKELQGLMRFNTERIAQLQLDREPLQEALAQLEGGTQQSDALQQLRALLEENTFQQTELNKQLNELTLQRGRTATQWEVRTQTYETRAKEVQQFEERIAQLKQEIIGTQANIDTLLTEMTAVDTELASMSDALKAMEAELEALNQQVLEQEKTKHMADVQANQANERFRQLDFEIRQKQPQLNELLAKLQEALPDTWEQALLELEQSHSELKTKLEKLQQRMAGMGHVNMLAIDAYDQALNRQGDLKGKMETLRHEQEALSERVLMFEALKLEYFMKAFESVNEQFKTIYAELSDGYGQLLLTNPSSPLEGGLSIEASPRGKKTQRIEAMSGGEKSLTSLAFVFALQRTQPAPFYALDEVDQNLDGINVEKLSKMIERESRSAQFVVVSLRKPMIDNSDRTVGVTQRNSGISKVTGIALRSDRDSHAHSDHSLDTASA